KKSAGKRMFWRGGARGCVTRAHQDVSSNRGRRIGDVAPPRVGKLLRKVRDSADLYELFSKVFAVQQPKECFWHVFDPLKHIFFEAELPRSLPIGETL